MAFEVHRMVKLLEDYAGPLWEKIKVFVENPLENQHLYKNLTSISIEHTLIEKIDKKQLRCFPSQFYWSDIGSWDSISEIESIPELKLRTGEQERLQATPLKAATQPQYSTITDKASPQKLQQKAHSDKNRTFVENAKNNFIWSQNKKKTYALIEVNNLIVVDQQDALLIVKKGQSQKVKDLVGKIERNNTPYTGFV